ncbi:hypothetical protein ACFXGA_01825 [Actinosynnema sp. NPDC059335]|uniref:hypothetical protein n=1 Tax=Actinosynnema sp. NPDC059335 TaxID=3346804 RepID=UPI003671A528
MPVEFELVVERGDREIAKATTGAQEMGIRLHADNQRVADPAAGPTPPYMAAAIKRGAEFGTPAAAQAWQRAGSPSSLPPSASVENLRGVKDLRDAAVRALTEAGAKPGLTGKGTGPLNTLLSTLSSENLQPSLPGMLDGPLDVPGLHEAALTFGQDADVKVYAKLVNPRLGALSDGVKLENPKSVVSTTAGEAKVTESADVSAGFGTGGAAVKQGGDPKDTVGFNTGGAEVRHAAEDSHAVSGGATDNKVNNLKAQGRTGLVEFDVEYRVVATIGGKTGVVDLAVPGSAAVRMPAPEAQAVLGKDFDAELAKAQDDVAAAAKSWRDAEIEVDRARHAAQDAINAAAAELAKTDVEMNALSNDLNGVIDAVAAESGKVDGLERAVADARGSVADLQQRVKDLHTRVGELDVAAQNADEALRDATADVESSADTVADLEFRLGEARARLDAAQRELAAAEQALADHRAAPPPAEGAPPVDPAVEQGLAGAVDTATTARDGARADVDRLAAELDDAKARHATDLDARRDAKEAADRATADLVRAERDLATARDDLATARDTLDQAKTDLRDQQRTVRDTTADRDAKRARYDALLAARDAQQAKITAAEVVLNDRRQTADARQQAWWDAKRVVDQRVDAYNATPAPAPATTPTDNGTPPPPPGATPNSTPPADTTANNALPSSAPPADTTANGTQPNTGTPSVTSPTAPPLNRDAPVTQPGVPQVAPPAAATAPREVRGPKPERSFDLSPGTTDLPPTDRATLDGLAKDLVEQNDVRDRNGYQRPTVTVTGPNAQLVADALAAHGIDATADVTTTATTDVHVDWDLKRPDGWTPPAAPVGTKVTDTVITSTEPAGPHPVLDDPSWRHSTAPTADWFTNPTPATTTDITNARTTAPITGHVRGEDGGVLNTTTVGPDGVKMKAWRGPIAYDTRVFDVNGTPVRDFTVKVHLDPAGHADPAQLAEIQRRTREGVQELFNQGHRLPGGEQFHVTVEFPTDPADAHATVKVAAPDGRANQLSWPVDTDPRRLAHEVGHFLGLHDEYFETGQAKPIFQHQEGKGRVVHDNAPMTDGIDEADVSLKPRNLWLVENRMHALESVNDPAVGSADADVAPPNAPGFHRAPAPMPLQMIAHPRTPAAVLPGVAPRFLQDNQALGSVTARDPRGVDQVVTAVENLLPQVPGVTPQGTARIGREITTNLESFLGHGRRMQVQVGNRFFDAHVTARLRPPATAPVPTSSPKVDMQVNSGATSSTTTALTTANDVGGSVTASQGLGAYGQLGLKAPLSTPAVTGTTTSSTVDNRIIRSGGGSADVDVDLEFTVNLYDDAGRVVGSDTVRSTPAAPVSITLQVPNDLTTDLDTTHASPVVPLPAGAGAKLEFPVPEAVIDQDPQALFNDVKATLHPSLTKPGAPGRDALREFLGATSIRDNLGALLGGWVTSPALTSKSDSYAGSVKMTASLTDIQLVGTPGASQLRLHDSAVSSTGVSAGTSSGFDFSAAVGGGIGAPSVGVGSGGVAGGYSAKKTESVSAGATTTNRTGVMIKGNTGLYKVTADVTVVGPTGQPVVKPVTAYLRLGLDEVTALNDVLAAADPNAPRVPVAPLANGNQPGLTVPPGPLTRHQPPYLEAGLAAGNVKVGRFERAADVQAQVEQTLLARPEFAAFLPGNDPGARPNRSGKNFAEHLEQLNNQQVLTAKLSPTALRAQMDSLLGPGVPVVLKRRGKAHNHYVTVLVKAKVANPAYKGEAGLHFVRGSSSAAPKLDATTTTTKTWTAGVEGKGGANVKPGSASLAPQAGVGVKFTNSDAVKTTSGPTVSSTSLNVGNEFSHVFENDVEFEIEVQTYSRPRAWVQRSWFGTPGAQAPQPTTIARTGTAPGDLPPISGKVNLWFTEGSTMVGDPSRFAPGRPSTTPVPGSTKTIKELVSPAGRTPNEHDWLHVEAVTGAGRLRDDAMALLDDAAHGDRSLTALGTVSRAQIDALFSPENLKANLRRMTETGIQDADLRYDRRVADRTGGLGATVRLGKPKLVSISDVTGTENSAQGGVKAGGGKSNTQAVDVTAQAGLGGRPNAKDPRGASGFQVLGKWTPWSRAKGVTTELAASVDRNVVTANATRTVLVQMDASFTLVAESRNANAVVNGQLRTREAVVDLPGGVFVRVSEQVARDMGLLPDVNPPAPKVPDAMQAPKRVASGAPSALGLSAVDKAPDLSGLVSSLITQANGRTGDWRGGKLVPDSVLDDSMHNLQRMVDFTSPTSVQALVDGALDGGVPLLVHKPGALFGKDSYQVTLKAVVDGTPAFQGAVNDGVDIEHTVAGSAKDGASHGKGHAWSVGAKVPASGLPTPAAGSPLTGNVGGQLGASVGRAHSSTVTEATTTQFGHLRAGSGPAVKYALPVRFELVVERGGQEIARQVSPTPVDLGVRLHADSVRATPRPDPVTRPDRRTTHDASRATDQALADFANGADTTDAVAALPPTASVEGLRGASALRDAALAALENAGAGAGITGHGTGSRAALLSALSSENLQASLPAMLREPLDVPGLTESSLKSGKQAQVKVYARLVKPRLDALSDSVNLESPRTAVHATTVDSKVSDTADVSVAVATGGFSRKAVDAQGQPDPVNSPNFGVSGVEFAHKSEDGTTLSGGPTGNKVDNLKPAGRTGLVEYDVEYRVVATYDGVTSVVDLVLPGSTDVRVPERDLQGLLGKPVDTPLATAQTELKARADAWRTAEVAANQDRYRAQDLINGIAGDVAQSDLDLESLKTRLDTATGDLARTEAAIKDRGNAFDAATGRVEQARRDLDDLNARIDTLTTLAEVDPVAAQGLAEARQQVPAARQRVQDEQTAADAVEAELDAAVREAAQARADLLAASREQVGALEQRADLDQRVFDAERRVAASRTAAYEAELAWWQAKRVVEAQVDRFNGNPPAPGSVPVVTVTAPSAPPRPGTAPEPLAVPTPPTGPETRPERGPRPERSYADLTPENRADLDALAAEIAEQNAIRDRNGYRHPAVTVTGPNARLVADALAAHGVDTTIGDTTIGVTTTATTDVHVDWDLKRPEGWVPPAAPVGTKVTDTVITSTQPAGPHPVLDDPSWRHSTAPTADWFTNPAPATTTDITNARTTAPITSRVRGEDGGVLSSSTITPTNVDLRAWRGPIAYDIRRFEVDGAPVVDLTVKLHVAPGDATPDQVADLRRRAREGVQELFNQGHRLPGGEQFHVTVEFPTDPADAHATIEVAAPGARADQLSWPVDTDPRRLAHEVGHFLGLHDEYLETDAVKPIFQHQDGKGRVVGDNAPMTAGIDAADASLKPRNLWLVENRMRALESPHTPSAAGPHVQDPDVAAPNAPKRKRKAADEGPALPAPPTRLLAGLTLDDPDADSDADSDAGSDVEMAEAAPPVTLANDGGVHNAAFAALAGGKTLTPVDRGNYLTLTDDGIRRDEPPAFVVNMIVRASDLNAQSLHDVMTSVMANTPPDVQGRVAFVIGVNAADQPAIDQALHRAAPVVNGRPEPVALVALPPHGGSFKFGATRNHVLDSNAHQFAVTALAHNGAHPYVAVMDFDVADRRVPDGRHVFQHVADGLAVVDQDGVSAPLRPLVVGGGYRVGDAARLRADLHRRIDEDADTSPQLKQQLRDRANDDEFIAEFEHQIAADMHTRRNQAAIHPLLPYTPEPNLFFDGLVPLAYPHVRFGEGKAEFGMLGRRLNGINEVELTSLHTLGDPDPARVAEALRVDAENNRHPLRGQSFAVDFVDGATDTDLSRLAYELLTTGVLGQSHMGWVTITERFVDGKPGKKGTKFADQRAALRTNAYADAEPLRLPPTTGPRPPWHPDPATRRQMAGSNPLNPAISTPARGFPGVDVGVSQQHKLVAAHGLLASDHVSEAARHLRFIANDLLPTGAPPAPGGLYAAVAQARGLQPVALRRDVVARAATLPEDVARFTVDHAMRKGHLYNALVESNNWALKNSDEDVMAANARDLAGRLLATQLGENVVIHRPNDPQPLRRLTPFGPPVTGEVHVDVVIVDGVATYRPR